MATTELQCPKCNSNQLTANKKGFSGKQAIAGAILTGGIGLLAGTIGSNKVVITCLSCGKEFKPGEGKIVDIPLITQTPISNEEPTLIGLDPIDQKILEMYSAGSKLSSIKYSKEEKDSGKDDVKATADFFEFRFKNS